MDQSPNFRSKQMVLFYFVAATVVVVLIFAISIGSYYFDFYGRLRTIKKYLTKDLTTTAITVTPIVSPNDPVTGPAQAPVTIIEYADFTCPSCRDLEATLDAVAKYYGQRVRFGFKGIPITGHPERTSALHAAYCAGEQQAFWPYKTQLFLKQDELGPDLYTRLAVENRLDIQKFSSCVSSKKYQSVISQNVDEALKAGVTTTPTLFINGTKVEGVFSFTNLKTTIDAALANLQ